MMVSFKIVGIDHVVLRAADPAALERFYLDVLGLSLECGSKLAQLRAGHALIDIVPADDARQAVYRATTEPTSITSAYELNRST